MTARVLIGTSSWTDPTLLRSGWYPPSAKTAEGRLRHYASQFNLVEVDSTYYGMPSEDNARLWCQRTPADFTFDIKAFSLFTQHPTPVRGFPKAIATALGRDPTQSVYYRDVPPGARAEVWRQFQSALLPLDSAGKLGVVLFQFPPWFRPGKPARDHILDCQKNLPQYRLAIEFRNGLWMAEQWRQDTLRFLRDNNLVYVCVDEPQGFVSSVPPLFESTSDIAELRLHGRNNETWEKKGISVAERFRYLYSESELRALLPGLQRLAASSGLLHVLFNNCYSDFGVRNARDLDGLLRAEGKVFPDYHSPAVPESIETGPLSGSI